MNPRDLLTRENLWTAMATGAAIAAGYGANLALKQAWKSYKKEDPPENPASADVTWGDALAWTAATGLAMSVAKVLARRGAAAGWLKLTGKYPPV